MISQVTGIYVILCNGETVAPLEMCTRHRIIGLDTVEWSDSSAGVAIHLRYKNTTLLRYDYARMAKPWLVPTPVIKASCGAGRAFRQTIAGTSQCDVHDLDSQTKDQSSTSYSPTSYPNPLPSLPVDDHSDIAFEPLSLSRIPRQFVVCETSSR